MGAVKDAFDLAFADYVTDGVPASGAKKVRKREVRAAGAATDAAITAETTLREQAVTTLTADVAQANATANTALANAASGAIPPRTEVAAGQTSALPAHTYNNGTAGVGATVTANANGALSTAVFDGIASLAGTPRVWVGLEGAHNGLYVVTSAGSGGAPFVLTRATDSDTAAELNLCIFAISGGVTLKGRRYQCQQKTADITVGTTALTFALLNDDSALAAELVAARGDYASVPNRLTAEVEPLQPFSYLADSQMFPAEMRLAVDTDDVTRVVSFVGPARQAPPMRVSAALPTVFYLWLIGGQSNGGGRGTGGFSIDVGIAKKWTGSVIADVTADPVGNASPDDAGSAWIAFARRFYDLTGFGSIFVPAAVGGSSLVAAANSGTGTWDTSGTLRGTAITALNAAKAALDSAGAPYQFGGVLWSQGEQDGDKIEDATIIVGSYTTAFANLLSYLQANTEAGANMPLLIAQTGRRRTADLAGWAAIRAAQRDFARNNANVFLAFTGASGFVSRGLMQDEVHYAQGGLNEMGAAMATVAAAVCLGRA